MSKDDDKPTDVTPIIRDDQALDAASYKKKSGDPVLDDLVEGIEEIDSVPFTHDEVAERRDKKKSNVVPFTKKGKK